MSVLGLILWVTAAIACGTLFAYEATMLVAIQTKKYKDAVRKYPDVYKGEELI